MFWQVKLLNNRTKPPSYRLCKRLTHWNLQASSINTLLANCYDTFIKPYMKCPFLKEKNLENSIKINALFSLSSLIWPLEIIWIILFSKRGVGSNLRSNWTAQAISWITKSQFQWKIERKSARWQTILT